ncbi:MAG: thioesterase-like protein [Alphaproteobacteria bacterium]|nr:thioesterase-like protein [Alphaproteobacteria bacterium]
MSVPSPLIHRAVVRPEWVDYNGHMNVAFYVLAFDQATDALFDRLDIGAAYVKRANASFFTLEAHICYRREVREGDALAIAVRVIDLDDKRLHYVSTMTHAEQGYVAATCEWLSIHVDMNTRRSAAFPPEVKARLAALKAEHDALPPSDAVGRRIGLKR